MPPVESRQPALHAERAIGVPAGHPWRLSRKHFLNWHSSRYASMQSHCVIGRAPGPVREPAGAAHAGSPATGVSGGRGRRRIAGCAWRGQRFQHPGDDSGDSNDAGPGTGAVSAHGDRRPAGRVTAVRITGIADSCQPRYRRQAATVWPRRGTAASCSRIRRDAGRCHRNRPDRRRLAAHPRWRQKAPASGRAARLANRTTRRAYPQSANLAR